MLCHRSLDGIEIVSQTLVVRKGRLLRDGGKGNSAACRGAFLRWLRSPSKTIMSKKRIKDVKLKSGALTYEENGGRLGRKDAGGGGAGDAERFGKRTYWKKYKEGVTLKKEESLQAKNRRWKDRTACWRYLHHRPFTLRLPFRSPPYFISFFSFCSLVSDLDLSTFLLPFLSSGFPPRETARKS